MQQGSSIRTSKAICFPVAGMAAVLATAVLSILAMPGPDFGWLAWVALIPQAAWVVFSRDTAPKKAGLLIAGIWLKWIVLLIWLRHVAWVAVPSLALVMTAWEFLWWWLLRVSADKGLFHRFLSGSLVCVLMGVLWGVMEHVRSQPLGFPMLHWAVSQWKHPAVLEVCAWVGGYGLSSLIVSANLMLLLTLEKTLLKRTRLKQIAGSVVVVGAMGIGWMFSKDVGRAALSVSEETENLRVAVVQPYQPAYRVWTRESMEETVETVFKLSMELAQSGSEYDWMLWPEGTLPWVIAQGNAMDAELSRFVKRGIQVPLLVGNMGQDKRGVFNGVHHYDRGGERQHPAYAKQVLVPFGEYIPGRRWWPWLSTIVPIPDDFVRGTESVLFGLESRSGGRSIRVSPLICYEDCFPFLSVQAARAGAEMLFVATYNVWYGEEWGAYVHASHAVIRSAETGLPVVRCGSAGWSGSIEGGGRILEVATERGSIYFRGSSILNVPIVRNPPLSFYVRYAEGIQILWFGIAVALFVLLLIPCLPKRSIRK
jgi:apolipoprotein N-acyltransferase